jgi:lipopolysaccharide export system permease protein
MRLLDRYLLRELCIPLIYCLVGFLIFWISFDLFSNLDEFQSAKLGAGEIAEYYLYKTPEMLGTTMPIALLLALLYTLSNHGRHNEIIAMRAAGQSIARISVPYLLTGLALSLFLFALDEELVGNGSEKADAVMTRHSGKSGNKDWEYRVNFRNAKANRIWNIAAFNQRTFQLVEPHVEWRLPDGTRRQIIAKAGVWTNDHWLFQTVEIFQYPPNIDFDTTDLSPVRTNLLVASELQETPSEIKAQIRFNRMNAFDAAKRPQFTLPQIHYLRTHLELNPIDRAKLDTQFQMRLAQPWTCIVVALIALPFGAQSNSRRNVFVGAASSIFICFAYFVIMRISAALGTGGYVPPVIAAWLPNVLFAAGGLWLTWKSR